jgi:pimeloyl-ACP methyl ester carboxylesterase
MTDAILPRRETGDAADPRPPVVFLHGLAGDRLAWEGLQDRTDPPRRTIAFDLPGHGDARDWPVRGHAGIAARAVRQSLDRLGIARFHLVGHSMGGAVACLVAMAAPDGVASLTLLAPGGFGTEINARLLRRFARAQAAGDLAPLVEAFFGFASPVPDGLVELMAAMRAEPGRTAAFGEIAEAILDGDRQGRLDLDRLADAPFPARVIWGDSDAVLPHRQMDAAPPAFARHLLPGVGHMPHIERPDLVLRLIGHSLNGGAG